MSDVTQPKLRLAVVLSPGGDINVNPVFDDLEPVDPDDQDQKLLEILDVPHANEDPVLFKFIMAADELTGDGGFVGLLHEVATLAFRAGIVFKPPA